MNLDSVLKDLHESDPKGALKAHWEESVASLPDGAPSFLSAEEIAVSREWAGLPEETQPILEEAARRILANPALKLLAWHCYRRLYDFPDSGGFEAWPKLEHALGDSCGGFYLLVGLAMAPKVRDVHRNMGVPETITRDTCTRIAAMNDRHQDGCGGRLGIYRGPLGWLRHFVAGRLFRLGRMEFKIETFDRGPSVFRHRTTHQVVALACGGVAFDKDGYIVNSEEVEPAWTSHFKKTSECATGYPISPLGHALPQEVTLPLSEWECVVQPGDYTLDMHIPAGGGMSPERTLDSMRRAVEFFPKHFPDKPCRAVTCFSWIYGPQLEVIFPAESNLVSNMRELYLFPVPTWGDGGLWFIFLQEDKLDPATARRDTTLRRRVADYLAAGGRWQAGGMFFLTDDLDRFGAQPYRSDWPEVRQLLGL